MVSVAVVVLDTLRYDTFEKHFSWLKGRKFAEAYSTSHWTVPAHASLLTGYYPSEIGVHGRSVTLDCDLPVLPEILHQAGYTTRMFTANPQIQVWDGWERGFDQSIGPTNLAPENENIVEWQKFYAQMNTSGYLRYLQALWYCLSEDGSTVRSIIHGCRAMKDTADGGSHSTLDRIRKTKFGKKEFLLVNIMDTHTPYDPPDDSTQGPVDVVVADAFAGTVSDPELVRRAYDSAASHLSDIYSEIFDELMDDFEYVITLSDHGELLGEHDMWNHSYGLYPELTHVPIVISGNDVENDTLTDVVSLLDVHRTIADLANVKVPSRGQNLLHEPDSREYLFEYHGLLSWHRDQFQRRGLSDNLYEDHDTRLSGFVAPNGSYAHETHTRGIQTYGDIDSSDPERHLRSLTHDLSERQIEAEDMSISDEVREQLETLGYA